MGTTSGHTHPWNVLRAFMERQKSRDERDRGDDNEKILRHLQALLRLDQDG